MYVTKNQHYTFPLNRKIQHYEEYVRTHYFLLT